MKCRVEVKGMRIGTRHFMCGLEYKYETYIIGAPALDKAEEIAKVSFIHDYGEWEYIDIVKSEVI